jgi:hypothetical protein
MRRGWAPEARRANLFSREKGAKSREQRTEDDGQRTERGVA